MRDSVGRPEIAAGSAGRVVGWHDGRMNESGLAGESTHHRVVVLDPSEVNGLVLCHLQGLDAERAAGRHLRQHEAGAVLIRDGPQLGLRHAGVAAPFVGPRRLGVELVLGAVVADHEAAEAAVVLPDGQRELDDEAPGAGVHVFVRHPVNRPCGVRRQRRHHHPWLFFGAGPDRTPHRRPNWRRAGRRPRLRSGRQRLRSVRSHRQRCSDVARVSDRHLGDARIETKI